MNDRIEALLEINNRHRDRVDKRCGYGWKISFGLWTALGSLGGLVLTGKPVHLELFEAIISAVIILLILIAYFAKWLPSLAKRNINDRALAKLYLDEAMAEPEATIKDTVRDDEKKSLLIDSDKMIKGKWYWDWGIFTQMVITVCLALLVFIAGSAAVRAPRNTQQTQETGQKLEIKYTTTQPSKSISGSITN